jgi:hypothetical protein
MGLLNQEGRTRMMHAVIRNGQDDALHLIGAVDAYTIESLRDHTSSMWCWGGLSIEIDVSTEEAESLAQKAGGWLGRLTRRGVSVAVRQRSPLSDVRQLAE